MKQITDGNEIIGKTITGACMSRGKFALTFGEEFGFLEIEHGYVQDKDEIVFMDYECELIDLYYADLITKEEYDVLYKKKRTELDAKLKESRRKQYLKLKEEFEE